MVRPQAPTCHDLRKHEDEEAQRARGNASCLRVVETGPKTGAKSTQHEKAPPRRPRAERIYDCEEDRALGARDPQAAQGPTADLLIVVGVPLVDRVEQLRGSRLMGLRTGGAPS